MPRDLIIKLIPGAIVAIPGIYLFIRLSPITEALAAAALPF